MLTPTSLQKTHGSTVQFGMRKPTCFWHWKSRIFPRWWFQAFFIFAPIWGNDQFWLIFFRWVETTNQLVDRHYSLKPPFEPGKNPWLVGLYRGYINGLKPPTNIFLFPLFAFHHFATDSGGNMNWLLGLLKSRDERCEPRANQKGCILNDIWYMIVYIVK